MRVTNNLIYNQASKNIGQSNDKLLDIQGKISAQTNILKPSDDPVGASQILMYDGKNQTLRQYDEAMKMATGNLEYQEIALDSMKDFLDTARTLFIQAQNDINTQADIDAIAHEISLITESMADLMNSKSVDGSYIFAGTDSKNPAFVLGSDGRYHWSGNEEQKYAQISEGLKIPVTNSGKALFQDVWTNRTFNAKIVEGNVLLTDKVKDQADLDTFMAKNYDPEHPNLNKYHLKTFYADDQVPPAAEASTEKSDEDKNDYHLFTGMPAQYVVTDSEGNEVESGVYKVGKPIVFSGMSFIVEGEPGATIDITLQKPKKDNVLNQIKDALAVLKDKNSTYADREAAFFSATFSINETQQKIGDGRSELGARLNMITDREGFSSANQLSNSIAQSREGELDMGIAATELSMKESALNASQKVFSRMSNLSLFNQM
ncbi:MULTISPECIES: flagellar hook-associated protein FlgL [Marinomonas]|uniref:Flagellar hook-associated protein FlgL n=1 Tax=Marinomonas arctica TaxID=383750 RepID=A0A7H1J3Q1_9GAMM|nr:MULTISPECIES: flagellar hook-associated protein FlgL [Marinomonas]MCS7487005.1 flagellar hook protein [Marinomonas sp. BSi20414]QNT05117.1 flagellar hook-associated protein FlgL [Marinomonas arctica]GGN16016.1 flagellar hook-associated protein FlgL [Marinomonas arctica]